MRTISIFLFLTNLSFAQSNRIEEILDQSRIQIERLSINNSESTTLINSDFAKPGLAMKSLNDLTILKIYYVYTEFSQNETFDQMLLDRDRMQQLRKVSPKLFEDEMIDWEIIEQTGCISASQGNDYFHGFVIVHRPADTPKNREEEVRLIEEFFNGSMTSFDAPKLDPVLDQIHAESKVDILKEQEEKKRVAPRHFAEFPGGETALLEYFQNSLDVAGTITLKRQDFWVPCNLEIDEQGEIVAIEYLNKDLPQHVQELVQKSLDEMPIWKPANDKGLGVPSQTQLDIRVSYDRQLNGMYYRDGRVPDLKKEPEILVKKSTTEKIIEQESQKEQSPLQENTLYISLDKCEDHDKKAILMDVTGSMTTFVATMGIWLKKNPEKLNVSTYTFYNDGNNKKTTEKMIGKTGGMYSTNNREEVVETIVTAMKRGGGGEPSECDIEALLYVQSSDPNAESILFIADNYSEIRDLSLLPGLTKRTDIILCSVKDVVRTEYLQIAKQTGGSIIINGRRFDIGAMIEGEEISIEGKVYKYKANKFKIKD